MARLYEVLLSGTVSGERWNMRYNYLSSDTVGVTNGALLLSRALGFRDNDPVLPGIQLPAGSVIATLQLCMHGATFIDRLDVLNVYDPTDFLSTPISPPIQGTFAGAAMPPFVTVKIRSTVRRRDIRPGQKALPGVSEDAQDNGVLSGASLVLFNAHAAALGETIVGDQGGVSDSFQPCIASKERYPVPDSDTFAYRYRPATGPNNQFDNLAVGITWATVAEVSSQVSRKRGTGI